MQRVLAPKLLAIILALSAVAAFAQQALSQEIVIKDTAGIVRNITQLDQPGTVEFTLTDAAGAPADGVPVTLKNEATGMQRTAISANGVVDFDSLEPGVWTVSTAQPNITFVSISVAQGGAEVGGVAVGPIIGVVGAGSAIAGGTVAIVQGTQGGHHDDELSPSS